MSTALPFVRFRQNKIQEEFSVCPPSLQQQIKECVQQMQHNQMLFDLETEPELVEQRVFEYRALQCRYSYLQRLARAKGLRVPV